MAITGTPLAVGIPGYVVPSDSSTQLHLTYSSPVVSIDVGGAFTVTGSGTKYKLVPASSAWGRTRVTIKYKDGKSQTVHYFITRSAPASLADLGHFFTTAAHFTDTTDPFGRAPSIMTYDREVNKMVLQDGRVWHAGLSDEAGTGAYLATAMKQFIQPNAQEVTVVDDFVQDTLVGTLQQNGSDGVVASAFFYQPGVVSYNYNNSINWGTWAAWDRQRSYTTRRAYNYIHPVATYWAMYRVARDYPAQKLRQNWSWYLRRATNTTQYCLSNKAANCDYGLVGLMGEWVLGEVLEDLKRENMTAEVTAMETTMRFRANTWEGQAVPYGSEMAWDSTGQEGVYYWTKYPFFLVLVVQSANQPQLLQAPQHAPEDHSQYSSLHACHRSLGLERQRPTLLGLHLWRETSTNRAPDPSLRLRTQLPPHAAFVRAKHIQRLICPAHWLRGKHGAVDEY